MAFLTAKAFYFSYGNALNAYVRKRFPNFVKLKWLDNCGYKFHIFLLMQLDARF
jgi:hypothetical protein